jgi:hypothetical protein
MELTVCAGQGEFWRRMVGKVLGSGMQAAAVADGLGVQLVHDL